MSGLPSVNGWFAQGKGTVCAGQRDGLSGVNFCHPALDAGSMSLRIPFVIPHSMRDPCRCGVILEEVLFYWSYTHSFCNGFCQIERWKDDGVQDGSFSFGMDNATDGTRSDGTHILQKTYRDFLLLLQLFDAFGGNAEETLDFGCQEKFFVLRELNGSSTSNAAGGWIVGETKRGRRLHFFSVNEFFRENGKLQCFDLVDFIWDRLHNQAAIT